MSRAPAAAGASPARVPDGRREGARTAPARAAGQPGSVPSTAGRRPDLDLMRVLVVVGLIVVHSALPFSSIDWYLRDAHTSVGFDILILFGATWGMPLLFAVSGMAAWYALRTRTAGAFLRERTRRLLVPFVTGLVILVPPMFYLQRLGAPGFHESYVHFWMRFLGDPAALVSGTLWPGFWRSGTDDFDVSHLYFLYVLLLLCIVLLPVFSRLRGPAGARVLERIAAFVERHPVTLLLAGAVPMAAVEASLGPSDMTGSWSRPAYAFPFLLGFVLASNPRFGAVLQRVRFRALAGAAAAFLALTMWTGALTSAGADPITGGVPGWGALQGFTGWAWVLAILGFAAAWQARRGRRPAPSRARTARLARYANQAVLPCYVLHHTVIVAGAWLVIRWDFPIGVKYAALVILSFTVTVALYEVLVRRVGVMRLLFGMKPNRA